MATIHFLNVKQGDCSLIQHNLGHVSVIDVCNASQIAVEDVKEQLELANKSSSGILGNFNQKQHPVNPIFYILQRGIVKDSERIFRFMLTHPDMDHMDGIKIFSRYFNPVNFWDTENIEEKDFETGSPYDPDDWTFYRNLRDTKPTTDPKRLVIYAGGTGQFYNRGENDEPGGDGIRILAPTTELIANANKTGDYNDSSYVILYRTANKTIIFAGDSHNDTLDHILENYRSSVENVDLLIAPHHGRRSDRNFDFLKVLNPRMTFFGNAGSEHLSYEAWRNRGLKYITNNQAGSMIVATAEASLDLYVTHKPYAERVNSSTFFNDIYQAYYCGPI